MDYLKSREKYNPVLVKASEGFIEEKYGRSLDEIFGNGTGDWPEDSPFENGNYTCKCHECGQIFMGNKHRFGITNYRETIRSLTRKSKQSLGGIMTLKYFTIKPKETVRELIMRAKFEVRGLDDFKVSNISDLMGRGIRAITLINASFSSQVKIEVLEDQVDEILEKFKRAELHNKPQMSNRRSDGLDNIEEFWK